MDKSIQDLLTNEFKVSLSGLTDHEKLIIGWFEQRKLFKYKSFWKLNLFLLRKFQRLLAQEQPGAFLQDVIQSLDKEVRSIIVLSTEWFTDGGTNDSMLITMADEIDADILENLWETHYQSKYNTFWLFASNNANYHDLEDPYHRIVFNLYEYCGVPDLELAYFFDTDFQLYRSLIRSVADSITQSDYNVCYDLLVTNFGFPPTTIRLDTQEAFDKLVLSSKPQYQHLIRFCLDQFTAVRRCTEALLESLFTPEAPNPHAKLQGDGVADIREFELFNKCLKQTLDTETELIESKHLKALQTYLRTIAAGTISGSGFKGMAERQLAFLKNFNPFSEYDAFQQMNAPQRIKAVQDRNKDMEDISAFHRLKFAIEGRDTLNANERKIFYEKLASIVQNESANVYSDIIELYLYFLFKASGTSIEMLIAKTNGGQIVSTCDYKFGDDVAADCKCIITDAMRMHHISSWCGKIGSQVNSTIGHQNVKFGGGVIALKDQEIDFLEPLRKFNGIANAGQEEGNRVLEWILKIHAEFRRHTKIHPEQVKFILLYYLPATAVRVDDLTSGDQFTVLNLLESLTILTTKYASDEEFAKISEIFGPITHYIFRFNNRLH
jgi:hypothetical protein